MKINRWLAMAAASAMMCTGASSLLAQNQDDNSQAAPPPGGQGGPGGGRGGRGGNFDPAQFRQQRLDRLKEDLEVTKDDEWKELQPRIEKVMDAQRDAMSGRGMFGFGRGRRGGGGGGGGGAGTTTRNPFGGTPMPEREALQRAIDSKASNKEMKEAVAKYIAARKVKEADLQQAQDKLREVLSPRQEAIATVNGLL